MPQSTFTAVVKDSWMDSGNPTVKHGTDVTFDVGYDAGGISRGLLEYRITLVGDPVPVPVGATIPSAYLVLYNTVISGQPGQAARAHRVTRVWSEADVTWDKYNAANDWDTAGGDYEVLASDPSFTLPGVVGLFPATGFEALAQDGLDNRGGRIRLLLRRTTESGTQMISRFEASEEPFPHAKKLVVNWFEGPGVFNSYHQYRRRRV